MVVSIELERNFLSRSMIVSYDQIESYHWSIDDVIALSIFFVIKMDIILFFTCDLLSYIYTFTIITTFIYIYLHLFSFITFIYIYLSLYIVSKLYIYISY